MSARAVGEADATLHSVGVETILECCRCYCGDGAGGGRVEYAGHALES